jgi:hypothetical protein
MRLIRANRTHRATLRKTAILLDKAEIEAQLTGEKCNTIPTKKKRRYPTH